MPEPTVTPADFTTRGETTRPTSRNEDAHATMPRATCFPPQGTCSRHQRFFWRGLLLSCCRGTIALHKPSERTVSIVRRQDRHNRDDSHLLLRCMPYSCHSCNVWLLRLALRSTPCASSDREVGQMGLPPMAFHISPIGGSPRCSAAQAMQEAQTGTSSREQRLVLLALRRASRPCSSLRGQTRCQ